MEGAFRICSFICLAIERLLLYTVGHEATQ